MPHSPLTGSQAAPGAQEHVCWHPGPKKPGGHSAGVGSGPAGFSWPRAPPAPHTPHSPSWHSWPLKPALQEQLPSLRSHARVFRRSQRHSSEQPGPKAQGGQAAPTGPLGGLPASVGLPLPGPSSPARSLSCVPGALGLAQSHTVHPSHRCPVGLGPLCPFCGQEPRSQRSLGICLSHTTFQLGNRIQCPKSPSHECHPEL